jgi:hypothetical protein
MSNKQVQNQVKKFKLNFRIIDYVRQHGKLPDLGKSKTAMQYYLSPLKRDGILIKKGYGCWAIDDAKLKLQTSSKSSEVAQGSLYIKSIRGHGFQFTLKIPNISKWDQRALYLKKKKVNYKVIPQGVSFEFKDHIVWLCDDSIVVYFPDWKHYYEFTLEESKKSAVFDFLKLIKSLEVFLVTDLSIKGEYHYRTSRQHFAKLKDQLAILCNKQGKKLEVRGSDGKVWLITDRSFKIDELEFIHSKTAVEDGDKVLIPFLNDLRDHTEKTGETLLLSNILKSLDLISKNQSLYGENALKHVEVINKLSDAVDELRKELKHSKDRPSYIG